VVSDPLEVTMNFGTFLLMQSPSARPSPEIFARGVEIAQAAETLGFRNVWLAEHHFSTYGYLSRPVQLATYIAAKTTRLRVGTAVIVVPLHHPLVIAEEIATLDLLAGGRVDIGLGRGYQHYEFERFGLELSSSRARWEEAVDVILMALEGKPFSYDGKFFKIPETTVFPRPLQQPHPPIWITAQSPDSVEAAVRRSFNVLTGGFGIPIERTAEFRKLFDRMVAEVKPAKPLAVGVQRAVYVTDSEADARAAAEEARWNMRVTLSLRNHYERVEQGRAVAMPAPNEPTTDDLLDRFLVIGTPETCIRQIKRIQDLVGITHFNCSFWFGDLAHARVLRSMELFAREVMPAFA
jgi:alkanesulfonate monooxygenase SsuD/methylene tetrahydromethanopterin reductase-like flavin-dependent oxidoreductase (luciferase family)